MTTRSVARLVLVLSAAAPGLLVACGTSNGNVTTPGAAGTTSATSSASSSAPAAPASGDTATSTTACATSELRVSLGSTGAAAGTFYQDVDFENRTDHPCTLTGYPGVSFTDSSGKQVGYDASRNAAQPTREVSLKPGQSAHASVGLPDYRNFPAGACNAAHATQLRVYPPNRRASVSLADDQTLCTNADGRPTVTAVVFGP